MEGFFDRLLEFFGISKPSRPAPAKKQPKQAVEQPKALPAKKPFGSASIPLASVPSSSSFRPKALLVKRQASAQRSRRPLRRQAVLRRHSKKKGLQFEIEEILNEARLLKKRLDARSGKKSKKRGKAKDSKQRQEPKEKLKPLTGSEIQNFRERLQREKMLSDFDIQRLKAHLSQTQEQAPFAHAEKPSASGKELRNEELSQVRKSLFNGGGKFAFQPQPSGAALNVPQGASIIIGSQGVYPQLTPAAQVSEDSIDDQIRTTESLMKALEQDYLKRRISEDDFKQRISELSNNLRALKLRKKNIEIRQAQSNVKEVSLNGPEKPAELPKISVISPKPVPESQNAHGASLSPQMQRFLEDRFGNSDEKRLLGLEKDVGKLMQKFNLSESEVEKRLLDIDASKAIESFDKLVSLIELEQKTQRLIQEQLEIEREKKPRLDEKADFGRDFGSGIPERKKLEVKAVVEELVKHRIVTDFDKLLELVQSKGKIGYNQALKELKIPEAKLHECLAVLEENSLVRVDYPPIGPAVIFDINYSAPAKKIPEKK